MMEGLVAMVRLGGFERGAAFGGALLLVAASSCSQTREYANDGQGGASGGALNSGGHGGSAGSPGKGGSPGTGGASAARGGNSGAPNDSEGGEANAGEASGGTSATTSGGSAQMGGTANDAGGGAGGSDPGGSEGGDASQGGRGGSGNACTDECSSGDTACDASGLRSCVLGTDGCWKWGGAATCKSGKCADDASCFACNDKCQSGSASCTSGMLKVCEADANGCLDWSTATACSTGTCASSTACAECNNKCEAGEFTCQSSSLVACKADALGCRDFTGTKVTCSGDTPACDASDGRCECNATSKRCKDASTSESCVNGAWSATACSGTKPVCVSDSGCQACTEHSQCPASACHLDGSKKGTCFDASTVVNVTTADQLTSGFSSLGASTERVFRLAAGTYSLADALTYDGTSEVAIVGTSGVTIKNGLGSSDARNSLLWVRSGTVYLGKLTFQGTSKLSGLSCTYGATLWMDDVKVSGFYRALGTTGYVHARRSWLQSSGLAPYIQGGTFFMENSAIGPNLDPYGYPGTGLLLQNGITIDLRYVTIAGNKHSIDCLAADPPVSGTIRNSILATISGHSVSNGTDEDGDVGSNCGTIQFENDAVDQPGFGTTIAWYSSNWFTSATTGDFHLTSAGKAAIPKVAEHGTDDPALDIDGDSRKTTSGYPGLDEP